MPSSEPSVTSFLGSSCGGGSRELKTGGNESNESGDAVISQATIYFKLGRHFLNDGSYELAINALTKAIELDPDNALAYDLRGIAQGYKFEYDAALASFFARLIAV
jgi:Tfp pilus assembly protein PilF